jgi:cytochrome c oxidase subunit III
MAAAEIAHTGGRLGEDYPEPFAEHFDSAAQQREAVGLGVWAFLVTEVLLFGVLFTGYTVYRLAWPQAFAIGSSHLYESIGAINTGILLVSSLTMALAVHASAHTDRRRAWIFLAATTGLGLLFLAFKAVEYTLDYRDGIIPGPAFDPHAAGDADPRQVQMFMVFYFIMTGLHAFHVLSGVVLIGALAAITARSARVGRWATMIDMTGLYWHLVDIIWVFLFPLMYLVR